jgi:transcriptional regulator with GAF, ATPase, and Fis domain
MMVPLIVGERTIGVVSAQSYTLNAFSQEQLDFLQSAASQIAVAVDNARLYEGLQNELAEHGRSMIALRQSEARMRVIIENFPYDLWMCNTDGVYTLQSQLSVRLAGNILGKR